MLIWLDPIHFTRSLALSGPLNAMSIAPQRAVRKLRLRCGGEAASEALNRLAQALPETWTKQAVSGPKLL